MLGGTRYPKVYIIVQKIYINHSQVPWRLLGIRKKDWTASPLILQLCAQHMSSLDCRRASLLEPLRMIVRKPLDKGNATWKSIC